MTNMLQYLPTKTRVRRLVGMISVIVMLGAVANFVMVSLTNCSMAKHSGLPCSDMQTQASAVVMMMVAFALAAIVIKLTRKTTI